MPLMDGFEVLAVMNKYHMISDIPVIMISAESASSYVERAYEMGVTDYISRPFNALVVQKRVEKYAHALCQTEASGPHGGRPDL